jgi:outer membrane protein
MNRILQTLCIMLVATATHSAAATNTPPASLTLDQCLNLALKQNPTILKARQEIERAHGLVVEVRAAVLPQVNLNGQYAQIDRGSIETAPGTSMFDNQQHTWNATIEASQLVYSGGRVSAAIRAARLTDQIALLGFQRTVADTVLAVRSAFYQILLNKALVEVRERSIVLLDRQLQDARHRFEAGTVPQFNVLRAEVELANAKPPLIRAQNDLRLAREALVRLLALDSPSTREFTDINFDGRLAYEHRAWELPAALTQALAQRPELQQAEKQVALNREGLTVAAAGNQPQLSVFADYGIRERTFSDEMDRSIQGWTVGARVSWPVFDGLLTRGKVLQARAQLNQATLDQDDTRRGVELEVRQGYSTYRQALELLEAQKKTVEQAEESLRLAESRFRAGAGTQLEVLSAQTAVTDARSNEVQALYDYNVALANLDRVTGAAVKLAK